MHVSFYVLHVKFHCQLYREPSPPFRIWIKDQTTFIGRVLCFVFCGDHFEFLISARGLLVRGLEPKLRMLGDLIR